MWGRERFAALIKTKQQNSIWAAAPQAAKSTGACCCASGLGVAWGVTIIRCAEKSAGLDLVHDATSPEDTQNPNSNYPSWLHWIISQWDWLLGRGHDVESPMTTWHCVHCDDLHKKPEEEVPASHFTSPNSWRCCHSETRPSDFHSTSGLWQTVDVVMRVMWQKAQKTSDDSPCGLSRKCSKMLHSVNKKWLIQWKESYSVHFIIIDHSRDNNQMLLEPEAD